MYYIVRIFHHLLLLVKFLTVQLLLCTNDFIEAIAIFTVLTKLCSPMAKYIGVGTGGARGAIAPPLFLEVARQPEGWARPVRFISIADSVKIKLVHASQPIHTIILSIMCSLYYVCKISLRTQPISYHSSKFNPWSSRTPLGFN